MEAAIALLLGLVGGVSDVGAGMVVSDMGENFYEPFGEDETEEDVNERLFSPSLCVQRYSHALSLLEEEGNA